MFQIIGKPIKTFNIILVFFGYVVCPFCFLNQFYKPVFTEKVFIKLLLLSPAIGATVNHTFYLLYRVILDARIRNDSTKELRVFFIGINAIFCSLAFYTPCCIKYIAPNFSRGNGIWTILFVHLAGAGIVLFVCLARLPRKERDS